MAGGRKRGLGKGLGALIGGPEEGGAPSSGGAARNLSGGARILDLDPHAIKPNPFQPRMAFDEESLQELADSIRVSGVHEPVIVREGDDGYELVSGERRVRASILADQKTVPAVCREVSDRDMLLLGIVENVQREDLNPIEVAQGYSRLLDEFEWTQDELAKFVGKKRATVTNMLRLLNLPEDVQGHVRDGALSMGHARALLAIPTARKQQEAARDIIRKGLSVRQAEALAAPKEKREKAGGAADGKRDPNLEGIEDELRRRFGTKVSVRSNEKHHGKLEIEFYGLDDLERILDLLRD